MLVASKSSEISLLKQTGFSLLETLIAFFVLSIGLIGIVSLLTLSKSTEYQSLQRIKAIALANNLLEKIRANPGGIETYALRSKSYPLGNHSISTQPSTPCNYQNPCSSKEKALQDLWDWEQELDGNTVTRFSTLGNKLNTSGLISPNACISFSSIKDKDKTGLLSVIIQWRGLTKLKADANNSSYKCKDVPIIENAYRRTIEVTTYLAGDLIMPTEQRGD